eukprot:9476128-Pyramimonas_sp.AAC.1
MLLLTKRPCPQAIGPSHSARAGGGRFAQCVRQGQRLVPEVRIRYLWFLMRHSSWKKGALFPM